MRGMFPRLPAFEVRRCGACRELKFRTDFVKNRSSKSGYGSYCKVCHNEISHRNRERQHGSSRNYLIRLRYGVDPAFVDAALEEQQGLCAICRQRRARHVDHDHAGGFVRGVLCFSCNGALGQFAENTERLHRALQYLAGSDRRFGALHTREDRVLLCVVCREWLPPEQFADDHRRHRQKAQWCFSCGETRGRAVLDGRTNPRRYHLLTKYGIDTHEVEAMIEMQGGNCAICQSSPAEQVDHDHRTRGVRGILCGGCNAGLGQLRENPEIIRGAIAYLQRWQNPSTPDTVHEPAAPYILSVA